MSVSPYAAFFLDRWIGTGLDKGLSTCIVSYRIVSLMKYVCIMACMPALRADVDLGVWDGMGWDGKGGGCLCDGFIYLLYWLLYFTYSFIHE